MVYSGKKRNDTTVTGSAKKRATEQSQVVTLENAEVKMASFIKYYKGIDLVPEDEWDEFLKASLSKYPLTVRFAKSHRVSNNSLEGRKGVSTQPELLREYFKKSLLPPMQEQIVNEVQADLEPVTWYPNKMVWQGNFSNDDVRNYEGLVEMNDFFADEVPGLNVWRTEPSMIVPPLLLTVQPHHKVLDMCSSQGLLSVFLLEMMYTNPRKLPDGFLISNDISKARRLNRWTQAPNIMSTSHDAKQMPDYYLSDKHTDDKKVLYDRILLDPPSTNDGNFGRNVAARSEWKVGKSLEFHKDQKAMLKRGLELLAPGGELLYTTTSMHPVENEAVVAALLRMAGGAVELVDVKNKVPGFKSRPGMTKWKVMSTGLSFFESLETAPEIAKNDLEESVFQPKDEEVSKLHLQRCMRVMPHDNKSGAFFCAVFKRKTAIPWTPEAVEVKEEPETKEPKKTREELLKEKYVQPIKLVFDVSVTEMEWTTEVTDHNLDTKSSVALEKFSAPELQITERCINKAVRKELESGMSYLTATDDDWKLMKKFYKLSDMLLPSMIMRRTGGKEDKAVYYLVHPAIKRLLEFNPTLVTDWTTRSAGLRVFKSFEHELTPDNNIILCDQGLPGVMQYIFSRVVYCTRDDIVNLMVARSLTFDKFSTRAQKSLEAMEPGCLVFYYKAEGRMANPNCDIAFVGWRNKTFVKDHIEPKSNDNINRNHYLRICGAADQIPKRPVSKLGLQPEKKVSDMETETATETETAEK